MQLVGRFNLIFIVNRPLTTHAHAILAPGRDKTPPERGCDKTRETPSVTVTAHARFLPRPINLIRPALSLRHLARISNVSITFS